MSVVIVATSGRMKMRIIPVTILMASARRPVRRMIGMRDEKLVNEFVTFSDEMLGKLLDLYNCDDWGCGWVEFLEVFTEIMGETIGNWQSEEID